MGVNLTAVNLGLNILGVLLGGGALVGVLKYLNNRQSLRNADVADIRDHYAEELTALRAKLNDQEGNFQRLETHWRGVLEASDRRHEECEEARRKLRKELDAMHEELSGLRAQFRAASADRVLLMEKECPPAPHSRAAAHRVKKIIEGEGK